MIADHLTGKHTIGTYALDSASWASWIVIDADDDMHFGKLANLSQQLHSEDVPSYLENSRRGGHLWLFFSPIPGFQARRFGRQLITEAKLPFANPQRQQLGVELYPKQDQLVTGPGSLVRLPLGIHRLSGKRYGFVHPTGVPIAPTAREQANLLTNPKQVSLEFIDTLLERCPEPHIAPPSAAYSPRTTKEADYSLPLSTRIKQAISVHDFVSRYLEIDALGRGKCPFHDDQHQSFQVHGERNFWHCYAGCGGGSIIHCMSHS